MSRKSPTAATTNLLWALAGGHCELCGSDVTRTLLTRKRTKYGQVAHIEAYSPKGARYNDAQSEEERNSISNLMLLCSDCHKLIDENPSDFGVEFLRERKRLFEESVKAVVDSISPVRSDVITLGMRIGENDHSIPERDWRKAMIDARVNVGDALSFDASLHVLDGVGPDTLLSLEKRINLYRESIHSDASKRTSVFAVAPQPVLIGLGTMLADDGDVDVYQKRRDVNGWSWANKGVPNRFSIEVMSSGISVDCALIVSVSGQIARDSYSEALSDSIDTVYELRALRTGSTAILLRDDWNEFKHVAADTIFKIHEMHPEVRRLHVFPAMPVSACVAFGMAWNKRLIPELVIYEKSSGVFSRVLSIGDSYGYAN